MTNHVALPLPDGRWLMLETEIFNAALAAGADFMPQPASRDGTRATDLLTARQVAEQLSIPATKVEDAARRSEIPSIRIGRYVRFNLDDVLAVVNPRSVGAGGVPKRLIQRGRR
jgi:excisionase family DNA binding protein